jgi:hypothetical protein
MELAASKFKEQCLSLLDNLDPEGIVITKRGNPWRESCQSAPIAPDSSEV